ncbi:hypothetical protein D3C84_1235370 [compost metagenome]
MLADLDFHENGQAEPDFLAIDVGPITAQDPRFLQIADAPQAWRRRQIDTFGNLHVRCPRVLL